VLALEGFGEILSNYYEEQKIGQLWRQVQPIYEREVVRLHDPISQIVFVSAAYLRKFWMHRTGHVHSSCRAA